ncbi:hypothetical protein [Streptomyces sp. NPDC088760]|uniref:hypothetical protein n=1 Tax=Streptomyces sp. NPDC088760 TaxID=3365890 RepID=UPI0038151589
MRRLLGTSRSSLSADSGLTRREKRRPGLAAVGLADAADRLAGTCSGGMVRRLDLAEALVGLDPIARTGVGSTSTPYAPPPA